MLTDDIWVIDSECTECKVAQFTYNTSTSTTAVYTGVEEKYVHHVFNLDLEAKAYTDSVQLEDYASINYKVLDAHKFVDVLSLAQDGILGLGHDHNSIVYKLYEAGNISWPVYSISYLSSPFLILDIPNFNDLSLVVEENYTIPLKENYTTSFFSFGKVNSSEIYHVEFSSLSSYITGPFEILEGVFKELVVDHDCHYEKELLVCDCHGGNYPAFNFTIEDVTFSIESEYYFIAVIYI